MKTTLECNQCERTFTKPSKARAEQALRTHVARSHKLEPETSGVLRQRSNGTLVAVGAPKHPRSHLSAEQTDAIVSFIRQNQSRFSNKTACFNEALEAAGATGRIISNSTAVNRYFAKAEAVPSAEAPAKPKYTRREKQPVTREVHVNFCPNCGCNMQAVATGIAMATIK